MQRKLFSILFFFLLAVVAQAQFLSDEEFGDRPALDRVRAQRAAFITQSIGLTPAEAEKFWPLYNEFEAEDQKIRQKYRLSKRIDDLSNEEAEKAIMSRIDMEQQQLELKRRYFSRMLEVVPARKLARFSRADREFKKMLLERVRDRRLENRPGFRN